MLVGELPLWFKAAILHTHERMEDHSDSLKNGIFSFVGKC